MPPFMVSACRAAACIAPLAAVAAQYPGWSTARLSAPRFNLAAAAVNDVAIIAGGENTETALSTVDFFDASSATWSVGHLSIARSLLAAASVPDSGIVAFAGGQDNNSTASSVVDIYSVSSNSWKSSHLSAARFGLAATTAANGCMYFGLGTDGGAVFDIIDVYCADTNSWSTALHASIARTGTAAAAVGDIVVFAGGNLNPNTTNSDNATAVVDVIDTHTGQQHTAMLSVARTRIVAVATKTKIVFYGGVNSAYLNAVVNVADVFDTVTGAWSNVTLPQEFGVLGGAGAVFDDVAYFACGIAPEGYFTTGVVVYTPSSNTWTMSPMFISSARMDLVAISAGDYVLWAGGTLGYGYVYDTVDIYQVPDAPESGNVHKPQVLA
jgi:hypothetical protein